MSWFDVHKLAEEIVMRWALPAAYICALIGYMIEFRRRTYLERKNEEINEKMRDLIKRYKLAERLNEEN